MFMIKTNTGFVKLNGSVNNSKHIELLSNKIKKIGLGLKHRIVGCTTDGAFVMMKLRNKIESFHQQSFSYTLHLAWGDFL